MIRLHFTEALLVAEWVLGPFDTENDLRLHKAREGSYRDDRMNEATVIRRAVQEPTLGDAAAYLAEAWGQSARQAGVLAGRVMEAARRIVAARPAFYDVGQNRNA